MPTTTAFNDHIEGTIELIASYTAAKR